MKPDILGYEKHYADDSGVEHGVWLFHDTVKIEMPGSQKGSFPIEEIDFYIDALTKIRDSQTCDSEGHGSDG